VSSGRDEHKDNAHVPWGLQEANGKQTNGKKGKTLGTRPAAGEITCATELRPISYLCTAAEPALSAHAPAVADGLYTSAAPAADDAAPAAEDTGPAAEDTGLAAGDTADGFVAEGTAPGTEAASVKGKKAKKGKKKSKATDSDAVCRPTHTSFLGMLTRSCSTLPSQQLQRQHPQRLVRQSLASIQKPKALQPRQRRRKTRRRKRQRLQLPMPTP
jgi:hypothetical protein